MNLKEQARRLNVKPKILQKALLSSDEYYVVIDPGTTLLPRGKLLTESEFRTVSNHYGNAFKADKVKTVIVTGRLPRHSQSKDIRFSKVEN